MTSVAVPSTTVRPRAAGRPARAAARSRPPNRLRASRSAVGGWVSSRRCRNTTRSSPRGTPSSSATPPRLVKPPEGALGLSAPPDVAVAPNGGGTSEEGNRHEAHQSAKTRGPSQYCEGRDRHPHAPWPGAPLLSGGLG